MAVAETESGAAASGKPSIAVKFLYGVGNMGESAFIGAVAFVFFYYTAVLGLSGSLVGAALFLGLCADAAVDPFFGSWSDNLKSRFGRRIPLMFFGGPFMALSVGMLFSPPAGLPEPALFAWLAGWAILVRAGVSMFHVPYVALGAEMSRDYHERSSVVAWRTVFGILSTGIVTGLAYSLYFRGEGGLQKPEGYPAFGWTVAALIGGSTLLSTLGSARFAAGLPGVPPVATHLLRRLPGEVAEIFRNASFRTLFFSAALCYTAVGVNQAFNSHAYVFVWKFQPHMIQTITFSFLGGLFVGVPLSPLIARVVEKKALVMIGMGLVAGAWIALGVPKILGLVTLSGAPALPLVAGLVAVAGVGAGFCAIVYPSMMADAADEHEHMFGRRREGLYFAGLGFAFKAATGLGVLVSGFALDIIQFPKDAGRQVGLVLPQALQDKIIFAWGPFGALMVLASIAILAAYGISRRRHAEVAAALRLRRGAPAE
ncbi:MAG: MFS transporter [Alphaproteobacteria bacterium]|nr:MFS transporter [Alphaproteobacteria bacterium]MBU1515105.1 MFS transporter [Alphaproteobacteria bacterium]MBU2093463.1 MFS transporter [Alphaproteobacteria bacterium]MBU2152311.1 MFS transporter [Alphaproteobacteria bacterium]MBU2308125.1 MFS transporter [Alphaproteobacteria bacterium]